MQTFQLRPVDPGMGFRGIGRSRPLPTAVVIAGLLLLGLSASGCGPGGKRAASGPPASDTSVTASAPASSDPPQAADNGARAGGLGLCKLVTHEEAVTAIGRPIAAGVEVSGEVSPGGPTGNCKYVNRSSDPAKVAVVSISTLGNHLTRAQFDSLFEGTDKAQSTQVTGVGESASVIAGGGVIIAFDRGLVLSLQVVHGDERGSRDLLVAMMRKALERSADLR